MVGFGILLGIPISPCMLYFTTLEWVHDTIVGGASIRLRVLRCKVDREPSMPSTIQSRTTTLRLCSQHILVFLCEDTQSKSNRLESCYYVRRRMNESDLFSVTRELFLDVVPLCVVLYFWHYVDYWYQLSPKVINFFFY